MNKRLINPDVIAHRRDDTWTLMNIRAHTHVEISARTLAAIELYLANKESDNESLLAIDRTYFSNLFCLMGDPTRFIDKEMDLHTPKNSSQLTVDSYSPQAKTYTELDSILKMLEERFILSPTLEGYKEIFAKKESLFDPKHIGTFHQQVGLQLLEQLRTTSDEWWPTQKFDSSGELLNTPYKYVQFNFFKNFFTPEKLKDKKLLDLGCGTGFYSKHFLENGAAVCGVDPNPDYIKLAKEKCSKYSQANFIVGMVEDGNDSLDESDLFDIIYISDMFLFYTKGLKPGQPPIPLKLLNSIKKHLKPTGYIYLTEPHGVFWQSPWMGSQELPYTILSEYLNKNYGVTPTLSEIANHFSEANLAIINIFEPTPDKETSKDFSSRAQSFATEFPLWWTFLLTHKPNVNI